MWESEAVCVWQCLDLERPRLPQDSLGLPLHHWKRARKMGNKSFGGDYTSAPSRSNPELYLPIQSKRWNEPTPCNARMPAGINTAYIRPRGIQSLTSSPVHRSSVSNSHSLNSRRGSISCSQLHYGKCDSGQCCCGGSTHR